MLAFLWRWRCPQCHKGTAIREGSFFAKSRLPLQKWLILLYWWATQYPILDAWQEAQVAERTAIQVYQWFCDVCSTQLLQTPIKLGGPGVVVQIDESLYCHKPKARNIWHMRSFSFTCTERSFLLLQYHLGRAPRNENWVFGMNILFFLYSTIAEGLPRVRFGFSGWWTHPRHQVLDICKSFLTVQLPLCLS